MVSKIPWDVQRSTVTYRAQPAIHATRGAVPLDGNNRPYVVHKVLWPEDVHMKIVGLLQSPSLHVCSGHSNLGDVRVDMSADVNPDVIADAARLPFGRKTFRTVLCDPPYNGKMQWNHDLLFELSRVASKRIIFQHWFIPADKNGNWRKSHRFRMSMLYAWQPVTYFGRAQLISVFDNEWGNDLFDQEGILRCHTSRECRHPIKVRWLSIAPPRGQGEGVAVLPGSHCP